MTSSFSSTTDSPLKAYGRFGRLSFLGWNMLMSFSVILLVFLIGLFAPGLFNTAEGAENISIPGLIMMGILYIVLIYFSFIFTIRRLHDRNHTGWLSLLMLVPLVNLFLILYLFFARGDEGINNYGLPRATATWEKVLGWLYILIVPLGILTAIAVPAYQDYVQKAQYSQLEIQQRAE